MTFLRTCFVVAHFAPFARGLQVRCADARDRGICEINKSIEGALRGALGVGAVSNARRDA
jgi:hypothetical protein